MLWMHRQREEKIQRSRVQLALSLFISQDILVDMSRFSLRVSGNMVKSMDGCRLVPVLWKVHWPCSHMASRILRCDIEGPKLFTSLATIVISFEMFFFFLQNADAQSQGLPCSGSQRSCYYSVAKKARKSLTHEKRKQVMQGSGPLCHPNVEAQKL